MCSSSLAGLPRRRRLVGRRRRDAGRGLAVPVVGRRAGGQGQRGQGDEADRRHRGAIIDAPEARGVEPSDSARARASGTRSPRLRRAATPRRRLDAADDAGRRPRQRGDESEQQVGQLVAAARARRAAATSPSTMLTESGNADDLLYQLGTMNNLTARTSRRSSSRRQSRPERSPRRSPIRPRRAAEGARRPDGGRAGRARRGERPRRDATARLAAQQKNQTQLYRAGRVPQGHDRGRRAEVLREQGRRHPRRCDARPGRPVVHGSGAAERRASGRRRRSQPSAAPARLAVPVRARHRSGRRRRAGTRSLRPRRHPHRPPHAGTRACAGPGTRAGPPRRPRPASAAVTTAIAYAKAQLGEPYVSAARARRLGLLRPDDERLQRGGRLHRRPLGRAPVRHMAATGPPRAARIDGPRGDLLFYSNGTRRHVPRRHVPRRRPDDRGADPSARCGIVAVRYGDLRPVRGSPDRLSRHRAAHRHPHAPRSARRTAPRPPLRCRAPTVGVRLERGSSGPSVGPYAS